MNEQKNSMMNFTRTVIQWFIIMSNKLWQRTCTAYSRTNKISKKMNLCELYAAATVVDERLWKKHCKNIKIINVYPWTKQITTSHRCVCVWASMKIMNNNAVFVATFFCAIAISWISVDLRTDTRRPPRMKIIQVDWDGDKLCDCVHVRERQSHTHIHTIFAMMMMREWVSRVVVVSSINENVLFKFFDGKTAQHEKQYTRHTQIRTRMHTVSHCVCVRIACAF